MGAQLQKSRANMKAANYAVDYIGKTTKGLADTVGADRASLASAKGGWKTHGLQVPASVTGIGPSELDGLLLAASEEGKAQDPGKPTVQRVLGRLVVQTAEWKDTEVRIEYTGTGHYTTGIENEHVYQKSVPASAAEAAALEQALQHYCLLYTSPSPRDS